MSDEEQKCPECKPGLPAWLATFADLMSLLMCFFVLLLSFAEMDVLKFKRLAGSMRNAFGVQSQVNVNDIPKGTSIIAQEFSPGKPEPTPLQVVMQQTVEPDKQSLELLCEAEIEKAIEKECDETVSEQKQQNEVVVQKIQQMIEDRENNAMDLAQKLEQEIRNEQVEIEVKGKKMIIRVQEKGSFDSGSAELQEAFFPILEKLVSSLRNIDGDISIEGHTDSIPIKTALFPSNFDLSVARSLEVARGLMDDGTLDKTRFKVVGWGATRPLEPNNTPTNRAANRRVEIIVHEPNDPADKDKLQQMLDFTAAPEPDPGTPRGSNNNDNFFELDSNEIF